MPYGHCSECGSKYGTILWDRKHGRYVCQGCADEIAPGKDWEAELERRFREDPACAAPTCVERVKTMMDMHCPVHTNTSCRFHRFVNMDHGNGAHIACQCCGQKQDVGYSERANHERQGAVS